MTNTEVNKRHLIVSDIHEELVKLHEIEERFFGDASHVTFLGDWFDKWRKDDHGVAAATYVRDHIHDPGMTFLIGNHDASYFFGGPWRCSGYDTLTHKNVREILSPDEVRRFRISAKVGKFLCSHAGFHPKTFHLRDDDVEEMALRLALEEHAWSPMWNVGYFRGGQHPRGGPVWLDHNKEFEPMEQAQIYGHTYDRTVRITTTDSGVKSYCLDTGLRHVILTDGDEVEIVAV